MTDTKVHDDDGAKLKGACVTPTEDARRIGDVAPSIQSQGKPPSAVVCKARTQARRSKGKGSQVVPDGETDLSKLPQSASTDSTVSHARRLVRSDTTKSFGLADLEILNLRDMLEANDIAQKITDRTSQPGPAAGLPQASSSISSVPNPLPKITVVPVGKSLESSSAVANGEKSNRRPGSDGDDSRGDYGSDRSSPRSPGERSEGDMSRASSTNENRYLLKKLDSFHSSQTVGSDSTVGSISMRKMRLRRSSSLTDKAFDSAKTINDEGGHPMQWPFWLRLWGMVPLCPQLGSHSNSRSLSLHRALLIFIAAVAFCVHVWMSIAMWGRDARLRYMCNVVLSLGALLGFCLRITCTKASLLGSSNEMLLMHARAHGYERAWLDRTNLHSRLMAALWFCSVSVYSISLLSGVVELPAMQSVHHTWSSGALAAATYAYVSGVFSALLLHVIHICNAQVGMIDAFCVRMFEDRDVAAGIRQWNALQGILRCTSMAVSPCLVILVTMTVMVLGLGVNEILSTDAPLMRVAVNILPVSVISLGSVGASVSAAMVSAKCSRVPALASSINTGTDLDFDRQYMVEYIFFSDAGFYIGEKAHDDRGVHAHVLRGVRHGNFRHQSLVRFLKKWGVGSVASVGK